MSHTIRILIADDHLFVQNSLSRALSSVENFAVVGVAPDGQTAVEMADAICPDVVLMDYRMPVKTGAEAARQILKTNPGITVIGISMYEGGGEQEEMREAGVSAFIPKRSGFGDLVTAIRNHCGQSDLDQSTSP
jgi:DNA-binding NarL/FixJ family response regulator